VHTTELTQVLDRVDKQDSTIAELRSTVADNHVAMQQIVPATERNHGGILDRLDTMTRSMLSLSDRLTQIEATSASLARSIPVSSLLRLPQYKL